MRHLISIIVVLLVCITCKGLERKEIAVSNLRMVVKTTTEQIHWLYGACDFVSKHEDRMDCDANTLWLDNVFTVANGFFYKDKGGEFEEKYKIVSCTYTKDRVFSDKGFSEIYRFLVKPIDEGKESPYSAYITIEKVTDARRSITIVTVPSTDDDGRLCSITVSTNLTK